MAKQQNAAKKPEIVKTLGFVIEVPNDRRKTFWTRPVGKLEYWAFKNRPRAFVKEPIIFTFDRKPVAQALVLRVEAPGNGEGEYKQWHKIYWNPTTFQKFRTITASAKKAGWIGPVFHGSDAGFSGNPKGNPEAAGMTYFTDSAEYASYFATTHGQYQPNSAVYPAYIRINKAFDARDWSEQKLTLDEYAKAIGTTKNKLLYELPNLPSETWFWRYLLLTPNTSKAALKKQGYDSIIQLEAEDRGQTPHTTSFVVFNNSQIRSTTGDKAPKKVLDLTGKEAAAKELYHVTLQRNVEDILEQGLKAEHGYQFFDDIPKSTYLTTKLGLPFWKDEIATEYGEPSTVLRVNTTGLNLIPDEFGTNDAGSPAYRVEQDIPPSHIKLASRTLTKELLEQIAWEARDQVCPNGDCDGKCEDVSDIIVEKLEAMGYDAYTAHGQFRGDERHPHAWVRVGEWEIDATQDQFSGWFEGEGLEDNPVYVGPSRGVFHTGAPRRTASSPVVYHATVKDFDEFQTPAMFHVSRDYAQDFLGDQPGRIVKAKLNIKNPADLSAMHLSPSDPNFKQVAAELASKGYDGAQYRNEVWVAFYPEQIQVVKTADHVNEEGFWAGEGNAASGVLPVCPATGNVCLAMRSEHVMSPNCWGTIGGAVQQGMSPRESAKVEMAEETGYHGGITLLPAFVFASGGGFKYHNFVGVVPNEFAFNPSEEHGWETSHIQWVPYAEVIKDMQKNPSDYHPGLIALFKNSKQTIERVMKVTEKPEEQQEKTSAKTTPELEAFMTDFRAGTGQNPLGMRDRVWNDQVVIEVRPFDGKIHLSDIMSLERGAGNASKALDWLCQLADKHGVKMSLTPDAYGDTQELSNEQLASWYAKRGFKFVRGQLMVREPSQTLKLGPNMKTIPMDKTSGHSPACKCEMCRTIPQWQRPWLTGKCHEFALALSTKMPDAQFVAIGNALLEHVGLRKGETYYDVRGAMTKDQFAELFGSNANSVHDVSREQVMKDSYPSYIGHEDELAGLPDMKRALSVVNKAFSKRAALEFKDTNRGYHDDQSDQTLTALVDGTPVGYMEYSVYQGEPGVQWLEVFDKRKGYGTSLLKELQRMYPEAEVDLGMLTNDGGKLIDSMKFNEQPTEYNEKFNELEKLTQERDKLQQVADAFYARENHTEEEKQGFMRQMENMNNIHDRIWELEQETFNKSRTKRYIAAEQQHLFPGSQDANFQAWFKGSKVVDKDGRPQPVFHGTRSSVDFDTFSVDGPPVDDNDYEGQPTSSGSGADPTSLMGAHFAVQPNVANQFAEGKGWTGTRYEGEKEMPRVIQVFLRVTNPKDFGSEHNLREFINQGKVSGDALDIAMEADGINPLENEEAASEWYQKYETDQAFRTEQNRYLFEESGGGEGESDLLRDAAYELASQARQRLETAGHDGIHYKNVVEGGTAWIVFDPRQAKSVWAQSFNPIDPRFTASKIATSKATVLYLDDTRKPIRPGVAWVRNYDEFVRWLSNNDMPDVVSLDHDLALEHYPADMWEDRDRNTNGIPYDTYTEPTGLEAAKYIVRNNLSLKNWAVHSANPVGRHNIKEVLHAYRPDGEVFPNIPFTSIEKAVYGDKIEHGYRVEPWEKKAAGFAFRSFKKLWHVGDMNPKSKRPGSYEGSGLSVSVNPEEWQYIAGIGGDLWELTKQGNKFLNFHRVSKQQRQQITQWGIKNGYVEPITMWRAEWYDSELEETRYSDSLTEQEAREELEGQGLEDEGTADTAKVYEVPESLNPTPKLLQRSHAGEGNHTAMAWDYLVVIYAEDMLQCDGVWWDDKLDQYNLSAPRGVIFKDKLSSWKFTKVRQAAAVPKPTSTQLAVLHGMMSGDGTIHREKGGFWLWWTPAGYDKWGSPLREGETSTLGRDGVSWCDIRTVRAMEKRGWVERSNMFPEEWRDVRKLTDAGQLLLMPEKTSALEPDSIDTDPDKEFDQQFKYLNSLGWSGRNPWYPEKYPWFCVRLYSDGWIIGNDLAKEKLAEGSTLAELKDFLSKYNLPVLRSEKRPKTIDAQPVQKKLPPLEYEEIGAKREVLPPLEYEDIGSKIPVKK